MKNNELDRILDAAFESLRKPPPGPSISGVVRERIELEPVAEPGSDAALHQGGADHEWLVGVACLLGALICAPSFGSLELSEWLGGVSFAAFGAYADVAAGLGLALMFSALCLPLMFVVLDD